MTEAEKLMREIFHEGCALIDAWVARMGGWPALPEAFDISSELWVEAEEEITKATNAGDAARVKELGDAFLERVKKYLGRWEEHVSKKAVAGGV